MENKAIGSKGTYNIWEKMKIQKGREAQKFYNLATEAGKTAKARRPMHGAKSASNLMTVDKAAIGVFKSGTEQAAPQGPHHSKNSSSLRRKSGHALYQNGQLVQPPMRFRHHPPNVIYEQSLPQSAIKRQETSRIRSSHSRNRSGHSRNRSGYPTSLANEDLRNITEGGRRDTQTVHVTQANQSVKDDSDASSNFDYDDAQGFFHLSSEPAGTSLAVTPNHQSELRHVAGSLSREPWQQGSIPVSYRLAE